MSTLNMWNVSCKLIFSVTCLCWITPSRARNMHQKLSELQTEVIHMKGNALNTTEQLFRIAAALDDVVRATACPENFVRFESSCYFFSPSDGGNQSYARAQCQSAYAKLVSIETKQELDFIHIHTLPAWYWTSAHKHGDGDYWVWDTTGFNLTDGYQPWHSGEPNTPSYYCAGIYGHNSKQYDQTCSYTGLRYICETKLPGAILLIGAIHHTCFNVP